MKTKLAGLLSGRHPEVVGLLALAVVGLMDSTAKAAEADVRRDATVAAIEQALPSGVNSLESADGFVIIPGRDAGTRAEATRCAGEMAQRPGGSSRSLRRIWTGSSHMARIPS